MERGYEVLIVDDEPIIRKGLKKMLENSGRPISGIRLASSGEEAIVLLEEQFSHFVFTDIRMPDMDGLELSENIRQRGWPLQIVVVSGFGEFAYAQKCLSYGVKEYLLKPVRSADIERILDKLINEVRTGSKQNLSMREFEVFMERISEAVWYLKTEEAAKSLDDWRQYTETLNLDQAGMVRLYQDALDRVVKLLNAKGIYTFEEIYGFGEDKATNRALVYQNFEDAVFRMLQYLQRKRKGNLIDPIEAAKEYIGSHLNDEISLEEVADYLGLNPSYFSQLFKQSTQETFVHFRMKKRMELAQQLLQNASYRMCDIAQEVGYTDYSHFAKTFKKWFGVSPTEFRNNLGIE
jgi:two-component system response regulator YesN